MFFEDLIFLFFTDFETLFGFGHLNYHRHAHKPGFGMDRCSKAHLRDDGPHGESRR